MLVCEAAGFDVILVETVGVGQSETSVRSMVDFFLLLMLAGAGDELQGIKKGIMELADALLINKADGDNKPRAKAAKLEYNRALHYLAPATEGWRSRAYTVLVDDRRGHPGTLVSDRKVSRANPGIRRVGKAPPCPDAGLGLQHGGGTPACQLRPTCRAWRASAPKSNTT